MYQSKKKSGKKKILWPRRVWKKSGTFTPSLISVKDGGGRIMLWGHGGLNILNSMQFQYNSKHFLCHIFTF